MERAREEMRLEVEQQRREEADDRKRWKRDMRERLTAAYKQLVPQPAASSDEPADEQRVRTLVDERVSAFTAHYERTIADLTLRIQLLESRLMLTQQAAAVQSPSPSTPQPATLSVSLSPHSASIVSYPVRSLSPSQSSHIGQPQQTQQQTPRGVLKKAVRFNEDVRQRMFTTARSEDEEKERDDDEYEQAGQHGQQQQRQDEDEFDMFQTRTVSRGWSAAPSTVTGEVVTAGTVPTEEAKVREDDDEMKQGTSGSDVLQQQQQQQQTALYNEWSTLSAPSAAAAAISAAVESNDDGSLASSYTYETADDSPPHQQPEQQPHHQQDEHVLGDVAEQPHATVNDDSSSEEEEEVEEEAEMDSTDDEPLDLTDLSAATDQPSIDIDTSHAIDNPTHTTHQPYHQPDNNTIHTTPAPAIPHPVHSAYATTSHQPPVHSTIEVDSDSDDDAERASLPSSSHQSMLHQSHLPSLSSLQSSGGVGRYKSSLAIRSMRPSSGGAVVVGDSEAVQDILTGGRKKQHEEQKEAEVEAEAEQLTTAAQATSKSTPSLSAAAVAAAQLLDGSSDDSEVEDGADVGGRGRWQLQASVDRVFGSNSTVSEPVLNTDSDDEDMVVVKG